MIITFVVLLAFVLLLGTNTNKGESFTSRFTLPTFTTAQTATVKETVYLNELNKADVFQFIYRTTTTRSCDDHCEKNYKTCIMAYKKET